MMTPTNRDNGDRITIPIGTILLTLGGLLVVAVLGSGYPLGSWRSILVTLLALLWFTLIVFELQSGKAVLGLGPTISKEQNHILYILIILLQCCLAPFYLIYFIQQVLHERLEIIVSVMLMIILWGVTGVLYLRRHARDAGKTTKVG